MADERSHSAATIPIPQYWTPAQADAVLELLYELETAVFLAYESHLVARAQHQASGPPPLCDDVDDDFSEDSIPF